MEAPVVNEKPPASIDFYPFAYALYNDWANSCCWYCLKENPKLKICESCQFAWFCDARCIELGWKDHKSECKALKKCKAPIDIEVRILGRIVTRHKSILEGEDKRDPNFYRHRTSKRSIMDIWAHVDLIRKDAAAMNKFERIYNMLTSIYEPEDLLDKETTFQLHCRDFINRHAISDKNYLVEIGKGLYLDLCAYDHSCAPNTIYYCTGFVATLRPLSPSVNLLDRSSTFYSYIELVTSKQQRQKLLKDTWYFDCQCTRCMDNDDHILTSMKCPYCPGDEPATLCIFGDHPYKNPVTLEIQCPQCKAQISKSNVMNAIQAMRFIIEIIEKKEIDQLNKVNGHKFVVDLHQRFEPILSKYNIYLTKLFELEISLTNAANHVQLIELYLKTEPCLRKCIPHNHPAIAFHLRNLGMEYFRQGQYKDAIKYLSEADEMLGFTLPSHHALAKSTHALLGMAQSKNAMAELFPMPVSHEAKTDATVKSTTMNSEKDAKEESMTNNKVTPAEGENKPGDKEIKPASPETATSGTNHNQVSKEETHDAAEDVASVNNKTALLKIASDFLDETDDDLPDLK